MSFSECGARSFTAVSVRKNAPESSGVYGLSNGREWLFIGEANNIRARLLEHLKETDTLLMNRGPTGFTFEECPTCDRILRQNALVRQFEPVCNRYLDYMNHPAHRRGY
jgi:excinuclease UvrABC nuclease subunit